MLVWSGSSLTPAPSSNKWRLQDEETMLDDVGMVAEYIGDHVDDRP